MVVINSLLQVDGFGEFVVVMLFVIFIKKKNFFVYCDFYKFKDGIYVWFVYYFMVDF